jgi:hypothetical protein
MIDPIRARRRKSIKALSAKMAVLTAKSEQFSRERDAAGGMTAALEYQQAQLLRELRAADREWKEADAQYKREVREARAAYKVEVEARRAALQNDPSRSVTSNKKAVS